MIRRRLVAPRCGEALSRPNPARRLGGAVLTVALLLAACSSGGDTSAPTSAPEVGVSVVVTPLELGGGAVLDPGRCPADWTDEDGVDADSILLATSGPLSASDRGVAAIVDGMERYFAAAGPIGGRRVELDARDDDFDPERTAANVEALLDDDSPLAFVFIAGSANNGAVREITDSACVPQLFNSTGLPAWGDPASYPWTVGGLLSYTSEALIWCQHIASEFGVGATVAGVFMDNDFGASYRAGMEHCADQGTIDLLEAILHDPAAGDVAPELAAARASAPQAVVFGSTGPVCSQAAAVRSAGPGPASSPASDPAPAVYLAASCADTGSYLDPVGADADGVRVTSTTKNFTDPDLTDDPAVAIGRDVIERADQVAAGSVTTGVVFAATVDALLRDSLARHGSLARSSLMQTVWQWDRDFPFFHDGVRFHTDGAADPFLVEAARIEEYRFDPEVGAGSFAGISPVIDVDGQTVSVEPLVPSGG